MSGIAMLAIFALAAGLMYARLLPALLAVPLMALGIAAVAGAGPGGLETTIVEGTTKLAPVIVTVIARHARHGTRGNDRHVRGGVRR
jgi:hypothetical protein